MYMFITVNLHYLCLCVCFFFFCVYMCMYECLCVCGKRLTRLECKLCSLCSGVDVFPFSANYSAPTPGITVLTLGCSSCEENGR